MKNITREFIKPNIYGSKPTLLLIEKKKKYVSVHNFKFIHLPPLFKLSKGTLKINQNFVIPVPSLVDVINVFPSTWGERLTVRNILFTSQRPTNKIHDELKVEHLLLAQIHWIKVMNFMFHISVILQFYQWKHAAVFLTRKI